MTGRCNFCREWTEVFLKLAGKRYCRPCWLDRENAEKRAKEGKEAQLDLFKK